MKPINIEQLKNAIKKVSEEYALKDKVAFLMQNFKTETSENFKLVLPTSEGLLFVEHKDILLL